MIRVGFLTMCCSSVYPIPTVPCLLGYLGSWWDCSFAPRKGREPHKANTRVLCLRLCPHMILVLVASLGATHAWDQTLLRTIVPSFCNYLESGWVLVTQRWWSREIQGEITRSLIMDLSLLSGRMRCVMVCISRCGFLSMEAPCESQMLRCAFALCLSDI